MRISLGHNGVTETIIHQDSEHLVTEEVQDVTPVLDRNQELRSQSHNKKAHMKPVASIPLVVYHNWKKEWKSIYRQHWTWQTYLAMKINSRDFSKLRTSDLRL